MTKPSPVPRSYENSSPLNGVDGLISDVRRRAAGLSRDRHQTNQFVLHIAEDYAFIRLQDVTRLRKFLGQMAGAPPIRFGTQGFRPAIVDDSNPARHYTAFVFVGYWLPALPAILTLWIWEIAGYFRYHFRWSANDIRCGLIGIRHGRLVRRHGPGILAQLIARDLKA